MSENKIRTQIHNAVDRYCAKCGVNDDPYLAQRVLNASHASQMKGGIIVKKKLSVRVQRYAGTSLGHGIQAVLNIFDPFGNVRTQVVDHCLVLFFARLIFTEHSEEKVDIQHGPDTLLQRSFDDGLQRCIHDGSPPVTLLKGWTAILQSEAGPA